jgi:hypothetical protein
MKIPFANQIINCGNTTALDLLSRDGVHLLTPFGTGFDTVIIPFSAPVGKR